jgi:hypothetical protein
VNHKAGQNSQLNAGRSQVDMRDKKVIEWQPISWFVPMINSEATIEMSFPICEKSNQKVAKDAKKPIGRSKCR